MRSNEAKYSQIEDPEHTSDEIGMTCVKVQDMSAKRAISYNFDLERMTSWEGDTGAYLQYAHVRLCSVERKALDQAGLKIEEMQDLEGIKVELLSEPKVKEIVFMLACYPDIVRTAFKTYEPCTIVSYCFK